MWQPTVEFDSAVRSPALVSFPSDSDFRSWRLEGVAERVEAFVSAVRDDLASALHRASRDGGLLPDEAQVQLSLRMAERIGSHLALEPGIQCEAQLTEEGTVLLVLDNFAVDRRVTIEIHGGEASASWSGVSAMLPFRRRLVLANPAWLSSSGGNSWFRVPNWSWGTVHMLWSRTRPAQPQVMGIPFGYPAVLMLHGPVKPYAVVERIDDVEVQTRTVEEPDAYDLADIAWLKG